MNKLITTFAIILLFFIGSCDILGIDSNKNKEGEEEFEISGEVLTTESYCQGAPPPPGLIDKLNTPKPVSGKTLYIKEGDTNDLDKDPIAEVTTDADGFFTVELPPGTYTVIEEKKLELPDPDEYAPSDLYEVDMDCLEKKWAEPDKLLEISSDTAIKVEYHENCFWEKSCLICKLEDKPCPIPS